MLSVLVRDELGRETIHGAVRDVIMVPEVAGGKDGHEPGVHIRFVSGDVIHVRWRQCAQAGDRQDAGVYVMNDFGKTVAKYPL